MEVTAIKAKFRIKVQMSQSVYCGLVLCFDNEAGEPLVEMEPIYVQDGSTLEIDPVYLVPNLEKLFPNLELHVIFDPEELTATPTKPATPAPARFGVLGPLDTRREVPTEAQSEAKEEATDE